MPARLSKSLGAIRTALEHRDHPDGWWITSPGYRHREGGRTVTTGMYLKHSDLFALVRLAEAAQEIVGDHCQTHVNLTDGCPYCEVASLS